MMETKWNVAMYIDEKANEAQRVRSAKSSAGRPAATLSLCLG